MGTSVFDVPRENIFETWIKHANTLVESIYYWGEELDVDNVFSLFVHIIPYML